MQYLGGKAGATGKRIARYCQQLVDATGGPFVEMFCGSLNIIRHVQADHRMAIDACLPLITMWRRATQNWIPPRTLSAEEYQRIKATQDPDDPLTAFALFGCSFGGKWCGGYAKDRPQQRYAECAANSIRAKAADCRDVQFECFPYHYLKPGRLSPGTVMYCDPPYEGTTGYSAVGVFDSAQFWYWATAHARSGALVLVSEGTGAAVPKPWHCVDDHADLMGGRCGLHAKKTPRIDRLWFMTI